MDEDLKERITKMLQSENLTSWERSFCDSILQSADRWGALTERQHNLFQKIEGNYTPEKIEDRQIWRENFTLKMRQDAKIIANYYIKQGLYYRKVALALLTDESFIPTQTQYNRMCENDYAKGVLRNVLAPPKFPTGTFAVIRAGHSKSRLLANTLLLVIKHSNEVVSHAKNAKPVCVLPVGSSTPLWFEERQLKSPRKRGK